VSTLTQRTPGRIGILGGTFDPIHIGHLILAEEARARLQLDCVILVPARLSPLKQETLFSGDERCDMVRLAIESNPAFRLSRVDVDRYGPSYTVETLRQLQAEFGEPAQLFFVLGMDSLTGLSHWRQPEEIIKLARIVAISRPGVAPDMAALEREIPGITGATTLLETLSIGISSTDIRERLEAGLPIRYQVPEAVEAYIRRRYPLQERGHAGG
jgi:nicotinate-nucleotide adenylyltransferase